MLIWNRSFWSFMMSFSLIKKTLKQNLQPLFWYSAGLLLYSWMIVAVYPTLDETEVYEEIVGQMSGELMAFLGYTAEEFVFDFETYIGGEYLTFMFPLIFGGFIAAFTTRFFTKEIESGVIANVLTQPISRIKIFLSKFAAYIVSCMVLIIVALYSIPPMAEIYDFTVKWEGILWLSLISMLFGLAFGGFCFLISVLFSERGKALAITLGTLIASYVIWGFGNINDTLKDVQFLSIFEYWKPSEVLADNAIKTGDAWVLLGIFCITTTLAVFWFNKRDITV